MTIRYRLDDLGWYQFEYLVQAALKAELGIGVESWGERRDFGRDVYCENALTFPTKHLVEDGPFIFQVKFVENANAVGANFDKILSNAVEREIERIKERQTQDKWKNPKHYTLVTNALISASLREKIKSIFEESFPDINFHSLGGNDICGILDNSSGLRRSFPQLLSIRDLDHLLTEVVNKDILERSKSAIDAARSILPVFVPTSAYNKAWKVLHEHHFVVLEGPPEMGKSSIAWMIGLTQLSYGWQAIVCDEPEDVFRSRNMSTPQVFIADDAFGRTEYDPARGSKWETQLDRVLQGLDAKHWLIWTSRKHILERARRQLDFQGKADKFPNPGAVLVNAGDLSTEEKALILYRHARAANLERQAKAIMRNYATLIIYDQHFTPERIRRIVKERLPTLVGQSGDIDTKSDHISSSLRDAVRNPTDRMRKSFQALDVPYKWVLISLLEAGYYPTLDDVKKLYNSHCPPEDRRPFEDLKDELSEAFIKLFLGKDFYSGDEAPTESETHLNWIHPSCRDLVIEELIKEPNMLTRFLEGMSLQGIKLSISDSGGARGDRQLPFMNHPNYWDILKRRCQVVAFSSSLQEITDLLTVLTSAAVNSSDLEESTNLRNITLSVCEDVRARWNKEETLIEGDDLSAYCEASLLTEPLSPLPKLNRSWDVLIEHMRDELILGERGHDLNARVFFRWVKFAKVIRENEPRFFRAVGFPTEVIADITRLINIVDRELERDPILDSADAYYSEAERLEPLREICDAIVSLFPYDVNGKHNLGATIPEMRDLIRSLIDHSRKLTNRAETLRKEADELSPPEPDYDDSDAKRSGDFDIDGLFSDL